MASRSKSSPAKSPAPVEAPTAKKAPAQKKALAGKKASKRQKVPGPVPVVDAKIACFHLEVRPSKIHRWGLYAGEFIPRRRKIIEYTGEKISRRETKRRADGPLNYIFTLNSYWCIDGSVGGSGAEYINHCCEPNCYAWVHLGHILYMSARDIEKGEELTIDYHFEKDVEKVPCFCGAKNCRGTINLLK